MHRSLSKRKIPPKPEKKKKTRGPIEVYDEHARLVYKGIDRRQHNEQVFFDSRNGLRRFSLESSKVSPSRAKALLNLAKKKVLFGKVTYPSGRSAKHTEKKQS